MRIFSDYGKIDFRSPEGRARVFGAVQAFANRQLQDTSGRYRAAMQALSQVQASGAPGDFPTSILQVIEKFRKDSEYDTGFEQIFDIRDMTGSRRNGFDLVDVEDGLTFGKVKNGGKAEIFKMAGAKVSVSFDLYGGGLGWLRTLIDDEEYWNLEDNAAAFINKWGYDRASIHYALIAALGSGYNITWQNPDPATLSNTAETYTANRDAQTLNAAAIAIFNAASGKGYAANPGQTTLLVSTPLELVPRLNKALGLLLQGFAGSVPQAQYKFQLLPTTMYSSTTSYYVVLPKRKLKGGNRMNLTIFSEFDIESYSDVAVGWGRYGAAIGDSDQLRRCATS